MKINTIHLLTMASALTFISTPAISETFSYTFISASYEIFKSDVDGIPEDLEGDGITINGAFNITNNFGISAGYGTGSADLTSGGSTLNADVDTGSIGAFFHTPVGDTTDFVTGVDIIKGNVDIEVNGTAFPSEDANGNTIFAGIRTMVATNVELNGFIDRTKIESDSTTGISFGGSYYINKLFTIDAGYSFDKDSNSLSFGATKFF